MAHILYSITALSKPQSNERLLYVSSATYGQDWISLFHTHSFSELFYVLNGEGTFCSDECRAPLKKDTLIIINPNIRHTETSSPANPLQYIVLGIDNLQFQFNQDKNSNSYQILDIQSQKHAILPLMQEMLQEVRRKQTSYEEICQGHLKILLLKLARITGDTFSLFISQNIPGECEFIKQYMDSNYQEKITLEKLSALVHWDKYYLSHMFSKAYGISPINYLLERRILHSKELLRTSNFSIIEIAQVTGFSSSNYFSQSFRKNTGISPRIYRQKHTIYDTKSEEPNDSP